MPFFSFSLKKIPPRNKKLVNEAYIDKIFNNLQPNKKFFSKNTKLWQNLNNKNFSKYIDNIQFEKRILNKKIGSKILFLLPPSIGLGDSIEYALAIKEIVQSNKFKKLGVGFVGRFEVVFKKMFNISEVYTETIEERVLNEYDTVFHFSLEVPGLINQKYDRIDIEKTILDFFKTDLKRNKKKISTKVKTISIFPISQSPIRSMSLKVLSNIIRNFSPKYKIQIILDYNSDISSHLDKLLQNDKIEKLYPSNINQLINLIKKIDFGIFMDSGPLHIAKVLNKRGILIETSVNSETLLNKFSTIKVFKNIYSSDYCHHCCGLVNVFNYKNNVGCYDSLKISKTDIINLKNFHSLQRGKIKQSYINFIENPVNCLSKIDSLKLINFLENTL